MNGWDVMCLSAGSFRGVLFPSLILQTLGEKLLKRYITCHWNLEVHCTCHNKVSFYALAYTASNSSIKRNYYSKLPVICIQESIILIQPAKISRKFVLINLFKNKFLKCICSPTKWYFSQLQLAAIPIALPHAGAIRVEASWVCNRITVYVSEIFHPSIW